MTKPYIIHHCKNKSCNNAWVDVDLKNSKAPPKWKYCDECVDFEGHVNPVKPPVDAKKSARAKELQRLIREKKERLAEW